MVTQLSNRGSNAVECVRGALTSPRRQGEKRSGPGVVGQALLKLLAPQCCADKRLTVDLQRDLCSKATVPLLSPCFLRHHIMPPFQACCAHDHDCESTDCSSAFSLHEHIDMSQVRCLNELLPGSCRGVFKPWSSRLQPSDPPLRSNDSEPELLLHIPFDGAVKLKAISVIGGNNGTAPAKLRVFVNRDDIDFATAEHLTPVQEWDLQEFDPQGVLEYPTQVFKFNGVYSIDLHFPSNFGADSTEIHFIGLKGEFSQQKRQAVTAVYESRAQAADHKVPGETQGANHHIS